MNLTTTEVPSTEQSSHLHAGVQKHIDLCVFLFFWNKLTYVTVCIEVMHKNKMQQTVCVHDILGFVISILHKRGDIKHEKHQLLHPSDVLNPLFNASCTDFPTQAYIYAHAYCSQPSRYEAWESVF